MKRQRLVLAATLGASFAIVCLACSSSATHPPAAGSGSGASSGLPSSGGTSDAEAGAEGGSNPPTDDAAPPTCATIAYGRGPVPEISQNGSAPPALGGVLVPGTYDLDTFDAYDPAGSVLVATGRTAKSTLVLTATSLTIALQLGDNDGGTPVETITAWTYTLEGTVTTRTAVCPAGAPSGAVPYTAVGNTVAIFPDTTHRYVFQKR